MTQEDACAAQPARLLLNLLALLVLNVLALLVSTNSDAEGAGCDRTGQVSGGGRGGAKFPRMFAICVYVDSVMDGTMSKKKLVLETCVCVCVGGGHVPVCVCVCVCVCV